MILRLLLALPFGICLAATFPIAAQNMDAEEEAERDRKVELRAERILRRERKLRSARESLDQCADVPCLTPSEATAIAFSAGPDRRTPGRFILDVRGGGPLNPRPRREEVLFFLNSERDYWNFAVLIVAIEPDALDDLLNPVIERERGGLSDGDIVVQGKVRRKRVLVSVEEMLKRFRGRRLIVDGEVGLQWIDYVDPISGLKRGGYHQVWVRITSPEQITVVDAD